MRCFSCNRFNHNVLNCPLLHYEIDRDAFIKRINYSEPHNKRKSFFRKGLKNSSLQNLKQIRKQVRTLNCEQEGEFYHSHLDY